MYFHSSQSHHITQAYKASHYHPFFLISTLMLLMHCMMKILRQMKKEEKSLRRD